MHKQVCQRICMLTQTHAQTHKKKVNYNYRNLHCSCNNGLHVKCYEVKYCKAVQYSMNVHPCVTVRLTLEMPFSTAPTGSC